ncbi:MAG: flagellar motor switch protein FliN, partial [Phycisphaerae bacterium]|nr:flagellar motor switch protein FliN [Phycisphaerae bacterium]
AADAAANVPADAAADAAAEAMANEALKAAGLEGAAEAPPLPDFSNMLSDAVASSIDMLNDVELDVKIELGRAEMEVEEILRLTTGSVVELDKLAGDPVDILANERLIARGEVLVINDNFCVRINEIIPGITEVSPKSGSE